MEGYPKHQNSVHNRNRIKFYIHICLDVLSMMDEVGNRHGTGWQGYFLLYNFLDSLGFDS